MTRLHCVLGAALIVSLAPCVVSAATPCTLAAAPEPVAAEHAVDGDTLLLDDGRLIRHGPETAARQVARGLAARRSGPFGAQPDGGRQGA